MHREEPAKAAYRADIDGLRAIAVLAVIFFHADFPWAGGGFSAVSVLAFASNIMFWRGIDFGEVLCRAQRCACGTSTEAYYLDDQHLTPAGAPMVSGEIARQAGFGRNRDLTRCSNYGVPRRIIERLE